ncbi:MAG: DsrE family protein [Gammaproteobacteria bacterium]|nr:DsrE family protein [Gammaproteobacteria bacterium]MDH5727578.1 DsrE family protein [Gammaproteobacteria bacterium]
MKIRLSTAILWCVLSMLFFGASAVQAEDKPFAEKRVVLQISDPNPFKQTLVLNVASNLVKHYGPDRVDVEIVAFGPGLRLLFADNDNKGRIQGLAASGVRFSACNNTMKNMTKQLGEAPKLNSNAKVVKAGVVQIVDLVGQGYILVKP